VGRVERARDLNRDVERFADRQPPFGHSAAQRLSLNEFLRDEVNVADVSDLVNRDDIRMIETGCGPGLLIEPVKACRITDRPIGQQLERDAATEACISGAIDNTHSTLTEFVLDKVVGSDRRSCW
jgi:hypothetical protein